MSKQVKEQGPIRQIVDAKAAPRIYNGADVHEETNCHSDFADDRKPGRAR